MAFLGAQLVSCIAQSGHEFNFSLVPNLPNGPGEQCCGFGCFVPCRNQVLGRLELLQHCGTPLTPSVQFSYQIFNFSAPGSYCAPDAEIACAGDAYFHTPVMELTKNDISEGNNRSIGRVWYMQPVPLWDKATGEVASFSTSFSFQIKPVNADFSADGMAFFLGHYPSGIPPGSYGANLGLFNGSNNKNATGSDRIVAVEFDTYKNTEWEGDDNHVGINVNSIVSVVSTSPDQKLILGNTMTAEISYDNITENFSVTLWMEETSYRINTSIDMRICLPEEVAIGFSAATGSSIEVHRVLSWSFNSTLEGKGSSITLPGAAPLPAETTSSKLQANVHATIASSVAILSVLVCAVMGFLLWKRRAWKKATEISDGEFEDGIDKAEFDKGGFGPRRYHYSELAAATNNFAEERKLGRGGFGHVYQGCLRINDEDHHVAIKKLSPESSVQGRKEFEAEVKIISRLRHRNLVQLIGWCDSCKGLLIVYELVSEGSLDKHIYNNSSLLKWPDRYNIIIGLGSAVRYLHTEWEQSIVHGDIKPSNIMLDSSYNTKLGDFGLARLVDHGANSQTTKVVMGTAGYIDPEFVNTRRPSTESDVYSFGIVLLEMVSGRHPVIESEDKLFVLLRWVWDLHVKKATIEAVDKRLRGGDEMEERQMERVLVVGLWCAHPDRSERPSMAQAMHVLQSEDAKLPRFGAQMYRAEPVLPMGSEHGYTDLSVWAPSTGSIVIGSDAEYN